MGWGGVSAAVEDGMEEGDGIEEEVDSRERFSCLLVIGVTVVVA